MFSTLMVSTFKFFLQPYPGGTRPDVEVRGVPGLASHIHLQTRVQVPRMEITGIQSLYSPIPPPLRVRLFLSLFSVFVPRGTLGWFLGLVAGCGCVGSDRMGSLQLLLLLLQLGVNMGLSGPPQGPDSQPWLMVVFYVFAVRAAFYLVVQLWDREADGYNGNPLSPLGRMKR